MSMLRRFVLYALSGWCMEVVFTGVGSLLKGDPALTSKTYIWMFFIYGLAILLEPIHNSIRSLPAVVRGGIYMVLIFAAEYVTGFLLYKLIGQCPWDYTGCRFSVKGFIRLDYMPAWFTVGLLFEKLHDTLVSPITIINPEKV